MKRPKIHDVEKLFKSLGLESGDTALIHSDIMSLGLVEKGPDGIIEAFFNVTGPEGNLVVPEFSFSFCKGEVFNPKNAPPITGAFSKHFLKRSDSIRSINPNHSFSAIGAKASELMDAKGKSSFGEETVFTNLLNQDAKVLLLGTFKNSFLHYSEKRFGVEYRYDKVFKGLIQIENQDGSFNEYEDEFSFYVRNLDAKGTEEEDRLEAREKFFNSSVCKEEKFSYGVHRSFKASEGVDYFIDQLTKDPLYFVDKNKYQA
ncbi:MAG: AAC(3) family N-acetyltransferase [Bacteriovoracaceae bacterium]